MIKSKMRCVNVGDRMCTFLDKMWPNVHTCIDQRGHSSFSMRTLMVRMCIKIGHLAKWQIRWIRLFVRFSLQVAFLWKTCHHFWRMIAESFSANIRLTSPMFLWSTLITLWSNHLHFGTNFESSCYWLNHNTLVTISCAVSLSRQNMVKCVF